MFLDHPDQDFLPIGTGEALLDDKLQGMAGAAIGFDLVAAGIGRQAELGEFIRFGAGLAVGRHEIEQADSQGAEEEREDAKAVTHET